MDFCTACEILCKCVDEFYWLKKGTLIFAPEKSFQFCDVIIGRRAIKHVIEQRKDENIFSDDIKRLLVGVLKTISDFDFEISNTNQLNYPKSIMRARIFSQWKMGVVVVLDKSNSFGNRQFITAFYCRPKRVVFMRKKKPQ
jgi:hypothetical protein